MTKARPDLLLISEPYQKSDNPLWVSDATGKAAIWSCNDLQFQEFDSTNEGFVLVKLGKIHFLSCYVPPKQPDDRQDIVFTSFLDKLANYAQMHSPVAIMGDFNAWAVDWGSKETTARGQSLLETMSQLDLVFLNTGNKWTYERDGKGSIVDLTFVSPVLAAGNNSWTATDNFDISDHRRVTWEISADRGRKPPQMVKINALGWKASAFV